MMRWGSVSPGEVCEGLVGAAGCGALLGFAGGYVKRDAAAAGGWRHRGLCVLCALGGLTVLVEEVRERVTGGGARGLGGRSGLRAAGRCWALPGDM